MIFTTILHPTFCNGILHLEAASRTQSMGAHVTDSPDFREKAINDKENNIHIRIHVIELRKTMATSWVS